ncbi:MAG: dockerin type I repeat-containing protein [Oscillospiraceae bacterium]|nr:dockerin type I repeat-containing protein [Oscillospiraceae bacterium]
MKLKMLKKITAVFCTAALSASMLTFVPMNVKAAGSGDVNNDGKSDSIDAIKILQYYAGSLSGTTVDIDKTVADVNGDGAVDSKDAVKILKDYADWLAYTGGGMYTSVTSVNFSDDNVTINWYPITCTGYEIDCYDPYYGEWGNIASIPDSTQSSYTSPKYEFAGGFQGYKFRIRAMYSNGATEYKETERYFDVEHDLQRIIDESDFNLAQRTNTSGKYWSFNSQTSDWTSRKAVSISKRERAAIERFANSHFKSNWTPQQKIAYTLAWIHTEVDYAYVGEKWNAIMKGGWGNAEAIFDHKLGQCVQYNGALAEMMVYLGYDNIYLVQGWINFADGSRTQHFWTEIVINGKVYEMETGNLGKNGTWCGFCTPTDEVRN